MLAIQRPRMGSTQPSDPNLPFGYAVDPIPQELFLDAPDPAPGAPLLSDSENREISNFFENLTSDQYYPCFGEGLNFSDVWLEDLPPTFMGSTTSFGQSPAPLHSPGHGISHVDFSDMMSLGSNLMPPPPPPPQQQPPPPPPPRQHQQQQQLSEQQQPSHHILEQHHSADVLAAATLLQNGSSSRSNNTASGSMFNNRDVTHSLGPPVGHLRHQPMEDFKRAERGLVAHSGVNDGHEATLADMFFSPAPGERGPVQRPAQVPDVPLQWGSDGRFNGSESYMPDPKDSYENMSDDRLRYMQCLQRNESSTNTRAPSPSNEHTLSKGHSRKSSEAVKKEEDADAPPRKRRKSRNTKDDAEEEDEESGPATKAARKRKTKLEQASTTPPTENGTASRRRKSGAAAKPPRENLSEAQKRENHIRSEQKRRTLIKEGFDDLCDLVPGLKGGGFSKSTMLTMAAEWLEEILKHNEELKAQMSAIEGR